ncbi:MAG: glycosyltransferase family 2 protein [Salibacteraceae bacterium]
MCPNATIPPSAEHPLVSIVTIVYNGRQYLERAMHSVLQQDYPNVEYIVIDGGSTDGSVNIIEKYASQLAYFTSEPDSGISNAFNKGLAQCKGEWIGFINADDWYTEGALRSVIEASQAADVVYGKLQFWKGDEAGYAYGASHERLHLEMTLNHPATFVRNDLYQRLGFFNEDFRCAMDFELLLRFRQGGARFVYLDRVLANMQDAGISDQNWRLGCQEVRKAKDLHLGKRLNHQLWFWKQTASIRLVRSLEQSGLSKLLQFYRSRLAPVSKTKAR